MFEFCWKCSRFVNNVRKCCLYVIHMICDVCQGVMQHQNTEKTKGERLESNQNELKRWDWRYRSRIILFRWKGWPHESISCRFAPFWKRKKVKMRQESSARDIDGFIRFLSSCVCLFGSLVWLDPLDVYTRTLQICAITHHTYATTCMCYNIRTYLNLTYTIQILLYTVYFYLSFSARLW